MTGADVLVVDDAPLVAASLAHDLTAAGHRPRVALTVAVALAELERAHPDAVVLDHCLDADASLLRHALAHARLPVLVVSGLDDDFAVAVAGAHGWSFLPKPVDADLLTSTLTALLTPQETAPMSDRPTIVPDASDAPAPIAPRAEAPLPAPPPAAQLTPSGRPVNVPVTVQVLDRVGDIVGVIAIALLCNAGKIGGEVALFGIGAILGVGTGLRQVGARAGTATGVSVVGLLLLGGLRWLAPAASAAELARVSGVFGLVAAFALGGGCKVAQDVAVAPHHLGSCDPGPADAALPSLCRGAVPLVCSRQGHLWPATPSGAPCPWGCFALDGGAQCGGPDGGLDAPAVTP